IGDYLGKVLKTSQYDLDKDKDGLYLIYYSDELCIYPNLQKPDIHLFNHSCEPNCWIYRYCGHSLFFALRNIKKGEELTISYLLPPKDKNCSPCTHGCSCGSKLCTGTMHQTKEKFQAWQKYQNRENKKTKIAKAIVGKKLKKLDKYPKSISLSFNP
ncbi:SET domain-containing protein, partial [Patescibacteria group bacterium]